MPNFKDILPNIFNNNNSSKSRSTDSTGPKGDMKSHKKSPDIGRLETDALPVDDHDECGNRVCDENTSSTSLSVSAELTESAVRELSNPNYDSGLGTVVQSLSSVDLSPHPGTELPASATNNTMNVHNSQQHVVMQFSNAQNLHFGSVFNINSNISASASAPSQKTTDGCSDEKLMLTNGDVGKRHLSQQTRKTTSIVLMMQSKENPNHRMLDTIATHLGEGWKTVMRELGHSDGQIEQALIDHQMHGGIKEVIYQLLLQWVRNADDAEGTLGHITTVLWECNQRDCVQRMKLVWKSEAKRKTSR